MGMTEILLLALLGLLVFGPKKSMEMGQKIGRALGEFKRAGNGLKDQLEAELQCREEVTRVPVASAAVTPATASSRSESPPPESTP